MTEARWPALRLPTPSVLVRAALLAAAVIAVLQVLHGHVAEVHALPPVVHWARDAALALPIALVALLVADRVARSAGAGSREAGRGRLSAALAGGAAFAVLSVPGGLAHERLFLAEHAHGSSFLTHSAADGMSAWLLASATLLLLHVVAQAGLRRARAIPSVRRPLAATLAATLVAPLGLVGAAVATAAPAQAAAPACDVTRSYDVAVIDLDIPYNRWGTNAATGATNLDADGMMYVLQQDKAAVKNWDVPLYHVRAADGSYQPGTDPAGGRRLRPRPLVLRANVGDCVKVTLTNELTGPQFGGTLTNPRVSLHPHGVSYDVRTTDGGVLKGSGGSKIGFNDDPTIGIGETKIYNMVAPAQEAAYLFHDEGAIAGSEADGGATVHGLFGALAVEPAGSTWADPVSGARLDTATPYSAVSNQSGELYIDAMIQPPTGVAFRESIQLGHDEIPGIGFGFNYGSEPGARREEKPCGDCVGEETSLSSWTYGDPALVKLASGKGPWLPEPGKDPEDCGLRSKNAAGALTGSCWTSNVTHAYAKDPIKFRYGLAGVKETHVFHMHAHQWLVEPHDNAPVGTADDPNGNQQSVKADSQTFGPGDMFTADLIGGAGSVPGTVGDTIFHCHLYPHFAEGFWSLFRVHDVKEDGTGVTPDGIGVVELKSLPNLTDKAGPTVTSPGYPRFIPGQPGWRAPQPYLGISDPNGKADDPATDAREDVTQAKRVVAGRYLDPTAPAVMVEKAALEAAHQLKGTTPKPGAPMVDPCPSGKRTVTYNVSVIQRDVVYNEAGWHDNQGRLYVLDKDVDAVMAGTKEPEPLFIRVNAGDCINFNLTSYLPNWIGGDAFLQLAQTNMVGGHIHLVKFDVLGSDGSSNGWNYQQAAFTKDQMDFNAQTDAGTKACTPAPGGCILPKPATWNASNVPNKRGQTIHERWYADSELRTVFTHDHHFPAMMQNRGQYGALVVEPADRRMRDPFSGTYYKPGNNVDCSTACTGDAVGTNMDILGPGTNDDFREFGLSFQDFVSLTKKDGDPTSRADTFNPPATPEHFPNEDPGVMGINYRNAPFKLRDSKNGAWVDPAYRFSSTVFGDPKTPLLQAYAGDNVRIRMIQGSQEEQNVWALHGMRWREEPDDPQSPLVNSKALGSSDAPNFEIPRMTCDESEDCKGDYLYSSTSTDATYLGMWGLMRVYGKGKKGLLALPDNVPPAAGGTLNQNVTGTPPSMVPAGKKGGAICPSTAPVKAFDVFATDGKIVYNRGGDHDPFGLMYGVVQPGETPDAAVERVRKAQEPMVLRANAGDCIEVTLTNRIDPAGAFAARHAAASASDGPDGGDPSLPLEGPAGTRAGLRVSLHPQLVKYDVRYSDGATVGFNRDQTVGPEDPSITYRWWADEVSPGELGATNLVDFGDVRGHRHHGLFAGLVVEPKGSTYTDPVTGEPALSGAQADIRVPNAPDFRENVPFFQDGLNLRDAAGRPVVLPSHDGVAEPLDSEDEGEKGFNYRSPRFAHRGDPLHELPGDTGSTIKGRTLADVFDSSQHGDPETPVFRAYAGDPLRVRVLQGSDKPRQHSFQLSGHSWRSQAEDPGSNLVGTSGGFSVSRALNVHTQAGGVVGATGDYRYNCGVSFHHLSGGLWGIERVYTKPARGSTVPSGPLGTGKDPATADNPHRDGYAPIQPLEQRTATAVVFGDSNRNTLWGTDERHLAGVPVELRAATTDGTPGAVLATRKTDLRGRASFPVPTGAYDLVVAAPQDFAATTPTTMPLTVGKDTDSASAEFGQVQLAELAVRPYNDANGNLAVDAGEASMAGWTVSLTGEGTTASAVVTDGVAAFGDLLPGSYSATVTPGAGYHSTTHKVMPVKVTVLENDALVGDKAIPVGYALKASVSVRVFNDSNRNGTQEPGESSLPGRKLDAKGGPASLVVTTATTDAAGNADLDDPDPTIQGLVPGAYDVTQTLGADWSLTKATRKVTKADGTLSAEQDLPVTGTTASTGVEEKTTQIITLRNHNPKGWVSAVPFNDLNNDGVWQDKEGKLVGWRASLYDQNGVHQGDTTTDNGGRATWYVDKAGGVDAPTSYTVKMAPREVAADEIPWTATTSGTATVRAVSGEDRPASFGFVQLGTIQAMVWHDLDKDGIDSDSGEVLANRTVRLYDAGGKTLLQQKVTDSGGMAPFKASAGVDYQLEVLLPTGWTATTPLAANGSPVTKLKVVGPTGLDSVLTRFGQYNTNDRTPPPDPTMTAVDGTNGAKTVTLSSEAGASFRYTLDGDLPTATSGMTYVGPITISSTKTLTAVALDAAGNASGVVAAAYTIPGGTTSAPASPGTWTAITGTTRGDPLVDLKEKDDGKRFFLTSALSGRTYVTDGYGTYVVPTAQRKVLAMGLAFEGRASITGPTRSLAMYNWATRKYEVVRAAEPESLTDTRTVVDVDGDPKRFMNTTTGEIRVKVRASATKSFELGADQVSFTVRYTP